MVKSFFILITILFVNFLGFAQYSIVYPEFGFKYIQPISFKKIFSELESNTTYEEIVDGYIPLDDSNSLIGISAQKTMTYEFLKNKFYALDSNEMFIVQNDSIKLSLYENRNNDNSKEKRLNYSIFKNKMLYTFQLITIDSLFDLYKPEFEKLVQSIQYFSPIVDYSNFDKKIAEFPFESSNYFEKGKKEIINHDIYNGLKNINKSIYLNPLYTNYEAYYLKAFLMLELGDTIAAAENFMLSDCNGGLGQGELSEFCSISTTEELYSLYKIINKKRGLFKGYFLDDSFLLDEIENIFQQFNDNPKKFSKLKFTKKMDEKIHSLTSVKTFYSFDILIKIWLYYDAKHFKSRDTIPYKLAQNKSVITYINTYYSDCDENKSCDELKKLIEKINSIQHN